MQFKGFRAVVLGAALFLPACSFTEEALWPSLTGEDPAAAQPKQATAAEPASAPARTAQAAPATAQPPALGTSTFEPAGVTQGGDTGTFVGKKVGDLRDELAKLQQSVRAHNEQLQTLRAQITTNSQRYHGTVAAINARLQVGTTPGNPVLVQQFNEAQNDLERLSTDIGAMNGLANDIANDSTMSAYLAESARAAFTVSGAVDEDHKQLAVLEDEVNQTVVLIDRLLKEVSDDVRRQTNYVATERSNLNLLSTGIKSGEIYGASLVNQAMVSAAGPALGAGSPRAVDTSGRRPLVVIRFDRDKVAYQQALYNAVGRVLENRPDAVFDLVAVAPGAGGPARVALNATKARRHAEAVLRSLIEMGLPPSRVAVSAKTSSNAKSNEVHLYLR